MSEQIEQLQPTPTQEQIETGKRLWDSLPNTITICQRMVDMAYEYRWGDNIGNWWSPVFDNVRSCVEYAQQNGLSIVGTVEDEQCSL